MKIVIEARALSSPGSGIRTYTRELIRHLAQQEPAISIICDRQQKEAIGNVNVSVVPLTNELWLSRWLNHAVPSRLAQIRPQVVHFTKAAVPAKKVWPTVVTIYDIIPLLYPASQRMIQRWYWPRTLKHAAATADHVLTISEASKKDIMEHLQVPAEKITVTPLAADLNFFQPVTDAEKLDRLMRKYKLSKPFILYLGTIEPRKNVPALIRAFDKMARHAPHSLVIAGRIHKGQALLEEAIMQSRVANRIHLIDFVAYEDLPALYSAADFFVWPSIFEGWGLPPLEAMACGTPVIVSDGGSLPEVVGQAGLVAPFSQPLRQRTNDSEFEHKLGEHMLRLAQEAQLRQDLSHQGRAQARRFSWTNVARQTLEVYRKVAQ